MSQNEPPSNHLASLTLDPSNTVSKESHPGSSTQSASVMEYASEEENAQFHKEFPNVPKGERLVVRINDRWQSLYVSEKHVYCSYFDKKSLISMDNMIAVYIRWSTYTGVIFKLQLITQHTQFAFFPEEETAKLISNAIYKAFGIICSYWRACLNTKYASQRDADLGDPTPRQTVCMCSKKGNHGKVFLEGVFLGTPKEIHHLLFMSEVGKEYWCTKMQKENHQNIKISDWAPTSVDTPQGQGHLVQTINYKLSDINYNIDIHKEISHCDFNDYISVVSTESTVSSSLYDKSTQCIMWETMGSSRFLITENNEHPAWYSTRHRYSEVIDQLWSSLCKHAIQTSNGIHVLLSLETAQDTVLSLEPSEIALILDLVLAEGKLPNSDLEYHQKCKKLLQLIIKRHNILPPSLFLQHEISTLLDLDSETADIILYALEPSRVSSVLDLLLVQAKSPDLDNGYHQKCIKLLGLLVSKHKVTLPSLFVQDSIHTLVDVDLETTDTILSALEPSKMPSVLDLILAEAKSPTSDLDNCRKCMRLLQFLVKKHNIIPPSLFVQDNICTLVNLDPETPDSILFAVEPSKIPLVLDLLLAEAKKSKLNHEYCRKCIKWLRLLVNRHFALPPSLFLQEITMSSLRIAAVGGYSDIYKGVFESQSVCLKVLKVYIEDGEEKRNKDLREFYKETLLWTHLNHSNLLPFLGVNTTLFPGKLALVAPWMANGEITKFLKANPTHDRLRVISEIAAGIMYLHSRNIVHGDIKGANVLVDEQGQCYLADFGLATAAMTSTLLSTTTSSGGKGTMRWMAPELLTSEETEDDDESLDQLNQDSPKPDVVQLARDMYAYACTVYEIIAGKIPFAHLKHDGQVIIQVINGKRPNRPTATSWCPNSIWNLVQQCWAQESHLRPTAAVVHGFLTHLKELHVKELPWEEEFLSL